MLNNIVLGTKSIAILYFLTLKRIKCDNCNMEISKYIKMGNNNFSVYINYHTNIIVALNDE